MRSVSSRRNNAEQLKIFARRYCWDMNPDEAVNFQERVILRVMDLGTLDDIFDLEASFDTEKLIDTLKAASPGSMRQRSWNFWHYRLNLADARIEPPPMPVRTFT